jgi:hypothetical protein
MECIVLPAPEHPKRQNGRAIWSYYKTMLLSLAASGPNTRAPQQRLETKQSQAATATPATAQTTQSTQYRR